MKLSHTGWLGLVAAATMLLQACASAPTKEGETPVVYEQPTMRLGSNIPQRSAEDKSRVQVSTPEALEALRQQQMRAGSGGAALGKGN